MTQIDLFWINPEHPIPAWNMGGVIHTSAPNSAQVAAAMQQYLESSKADALLLWDGTVAPLPPSNLLISLLDRPVDIWHAGLQLGLGGLPGVVQYITPAWFLNCNASPNIESTSWRVSLRACLVRREVVKRLGTISPDFMTLEGAGLEWGHRCIHQGAVLRYTPEFLPVPPKYRDFGLPNTGKVELPVEDELLFAHLRYKPVWLGWAALRLGLKKPLKTGTIAACCCRLRRKTAPPQAVYAPEQRFLSRHQIAEKQARIAVILPTLDRYDYLPKALETLQRQTIPPSEVIVVDQTPASERRPEIYALFPDLPLRVIWQDQQGQSLARNAALEQTQSEWIFFADDDAEYPPDLLANHLTIASLYEADGSTGLTLPPFPYEVPLEYRHHRVAYNLATGNALVRREMVLRAGGFDRHFDLGKGADTNLGVRLHLQGALIIHNPDAKQVHYKAARGGLRKHGVWWETSQTRWSTPWPSPTYLYNLMAYFPENSWRDALLHDLLDATLSPGASPKAGRAKTLFLLVKETLRLPLRLYQISRSIRIARAYMRVGPVLFKEERR